MDVETQRQPNKAWLLYYTVIVIKECSTNTADVVLTIIHIEKLAKIMRNNLLIFAFSHYNTISCLFIIVNFKTVWPRGGRQDPAGAGWNPD